MSSDSTGKKVIEGLATVGKVEATIKWYIAIVVASVCILIGVSLLFNSDRDYQSTKGKVTKNDCTTVNKALSCTTHLDYDVTDNTYSTTLQTATQYNVGDTVELRYPPNNPNDVSIKGISRDTIAIILFVVAAVVLIGYYIMYYFTQNSETYAAAEGTNSIIKIFK